MTIEDVPRNTGHRSPFPPATPRIMYLPEAVVKTRVKHLENPTHKIYVYLLKLRCRISKYEQCGGGRIKVEIAAPFPKVDGGNTEIMVEVELK